VRGEERSEVREVSSERAGNPERRNQKKRKEKAGNRI
jgi:hypothetical protein